MTGPVVIAPPALSRLFRMAIVGGVESSVRVHLERGDALDARDGSGMTPLMLAAARNRASICKLLLEAGADGAQLSPFGATALEIAAAAGAHEAVSALTVGTQAPSFADVGNEIVTTVYIAVDSTCCPSAIVTSQARSTGKLETSTHPINFFPQSEHISPVEEQFEFNLDGWEPEEDTAPPEVDQSVIVAASATHTIISEYDTFDSSADWDDVAAFLPDQSAPVLRADAATSTQDLRTLLLYAMRQGSASLAQIQAASINPDGSANPEMEAILSMAVSGVGADVVDREADFGGADRPSTLDEAEPAFEEEAALDEAMFFIGEHTSGRTDPLRFYLKELQRQKLLTSQQETSLARQIEAAAQAAVDALADWPRGIAFVLEAGREVEAGQRLANEYTRGPVENYVDARPTLDCGGELELPEPEQEETDQPSASVESNLVDADNRSALLSQSLAQLEIYLAAAEQADASANETLSLLRLNYQFLFELADVALTDEGEQSTHYIAAIRDFRYLWQQMFLANVKLAFSLAHKYRYSGEPLDDLTQAGNLGLLKAIERFDWRLGYKFSTYATWWIKQSIGRHVADTCRTIRLPVHVHSDLQRMSREIQSLEAESGGVVRLDAIAARMNMPPRKVTTLQLLQSEEAYIDEAGFTALMESDSASDFCLPHPEDLAAQSQIKDVIGRALSTLAPKEEQVIRLRFGIGIDEAFTLEEIGSQFGVTRERIRQIEAKALRKLRHPSRIQVLSLASRGMPADLKNSNAPELDKPELDNSDLEILVNGSPSAKSTVAAELVFADIGKTDLGGFSHAHSASLLKTVGKMSTTEEQSLPRADESKRSSYSTIKRKQPGITRLVTLAKTLDIAVDDDREGTSGHIWFQIPDRTDKRYRSLVRNLITSGFEFWPGKGYWK